MRSQDISFSQAPSNQQPYYYPQTNQVKKREVNLSVGGIQAGKRVDFYNNNSYLLSYSPNYQNAYPSYQSSNISYSNIPTPQFQNHQYQNSQGYANEPRVGAYSNNQYYQQSTQVNASQNVHESNGMNLKSQRTEETDRGYEYVDGNKKKKKKTCKEKLCCFGPLLWVLLGLIALAALIIGLLFAFGVLGGDQPKADPLVKINGVEYYSDSITVEKTIIQNDEAPSGYSPQSYQTRPITVNPVDLSGASNSYYANPQSHIRKYDDVIIPSSSTVVPDSSYNRAVDPIIVQPTRSLNLNEENGISVEPLKWSPNERYPGYFSVQPRNS